MNVGNLKVGFSVAHASRSGGGVSEVVRCLGEAVAAKGCAVRVFAGADKSLLAGTSQLGRVDTTILRTLPPRRFALQIGLEKEVSKWSPDLVHVHGLWMYPSWATHYWRKLELPYVVAPHGMLDRWALDNSAIKKWLAYRAFERASLEGAACLQALNESELSAIRDVGFRGAVAVITNGTEMPARTAQSLQGNKTLLYLGRLHPKKGLAELLVGFSQARKAAPQWNLVVVGWDDGGSLDTYQRLCADLDLPKQAVTFAGPAFGEEKEEFFLQADAFILPSKSEGMPMAVLEAWSYGVPVLMTPECNLRDGFTEGAAVKITCDAEALSLELANFFALSDLERHKIGVAGRNLVLKQYQWSAIAEQTTRLYSWILGKIGRPDFVDPGA